MRFLVLIFGFLLINPAGGQVLTSSNLPIIIITTDVDIIDEDKIPGTIKIINNADGIRNNIDDAPEYDGFLGIEIRGASSRSFPKKQYGVELRDSLDEDISASLLGLPKEEDWVLSAPYSDKSLMRNVLAYHLSAQTGEYAPRTKYFELVLNGSYQGVYALIEKIKRDKNRVNVSKMSDSDSVGTDVSGGYLMQIDRVEEGELEGFFSDQPSIGYDRFFPFFQFKYPKPSKIIQEQADWIENYVGGFENALASDNFTDQVSGYAPFIDVVSFIDFMLINEIGQNVDAYRLSTYVHKDREGLLRAGPVWDFNLAFGNADYNYGVATDIWRYEQVISPNEGYHVVFWWERLMEDQNFASMAAERWVDLRYTKFSDGQLTATVDSVATLLIESQERNFEKWDILDQYIWPNAYVGGTWENEVNWMKEWLLSRVAWMDDQFLPITGVEPEVPELLKVASLWPNPTNDRFTIQLQLPSAGVVKIELYDLLGRPVEIIHNGYLFESDRHLFTVDVANLSAGVYFIRSTFDGSTITIPVNVLR